VQDNTSQPRAILTRRDVLAELQICDRTLDHIIGRGELPVYKIPPGRLVRFRRTDVEALLTPASAHD
jgi:excisionase family DNA binding protein